VPAGGFPSMTPWFQRKNWCLRMDCLVRQRKPEKKRKSKLCRGGTRTKGILCRSPASSCPKSGTLIWWPPVLGGFSGSRRDDFSIQIHGETLEAIWPWKNPAILGVGRPRFPSGEPFFLRGRPAHLGVRFAVLGKKTWFALLLYAFGVSVRNQR